MAIPTGRFEELFNKRDERKQQEDEAQAREHAANTAAYTTAKGLFDFLKNEASETATYLNEKGFPSHTTSHEGSLTIRLLTADPAYVGLNDGEKLEGHPKAWTMEVRIDPKTQKVTSTQTAQNDKQDRNHHGELGLMEAVLQKEDFCVGFLDNLTKSI